jgi:hypothetical protein
LADFEIFISHWNAEKAIASVFQKHIREAFGDRVEVFVSSDLRSIEGGEQWFDKICTAAKSTKVLLILVSDSSATLPWILFEAGIGMGTGAKVIPIAIRGFSFGKLKAPLANLQGRLAEDLEGILFDAKRKLEVEHGDFDKPEFLRELAESEKAVTDKRLKITPFTESRLGGGQNLRFEIQNVGNVDFELVEFEVFIPSNDPPVPRSLEGFQDTVRVDSLGGEHRIRYTTELSPYHHPLPRVLIPSMGARLLDLKLPYDPEYAQSQMARSKIRYQLFVRDFDTRPEEIRYRDVPERT